MEGQVYQSQLASKGRKGQSLEKFENFGGGELSKFKLEVSEYAWNLIRLHFLPPEEKES